MTAHATWESIFRKRRKIKLLRNARSCRLVKGAVITIATCVKRYFKFTYAKFHQLLVFVK